MGPLRSCRTGYPEFGAGWHTHHGSLPQASSRNASTTTTHVAARKSRNWGNKELPAVGEIQVWDLYLWNPNHKKEPVGTSPEQPQKWSKDLEHLFYEDRLRNLEMLSLEKRRLWEDLRSAFQYLKEAYQKAGEGLFMEACSDGTTETVLKWKWVGLS